MPRHGNPPRVTAERQSVQAGRAGGTRWAPGIELAQASYQEMLPPAAVPGLGVLVVAALIGGLDTGRIR
ncbi:hypothetical protein [Micromonospora sp. DT31]|uniref:hypothetical protein n=1 Tax=Micromonospora sp. DT31 TaxID=3393434 RepID=UPI003CEE6C9C